MKHVTNEQEDIKRTIEDKTSDNLSHLNQIKKKHGIDNSVLNQQITTSTNEFRKLYNDLYDVDEELEQKINESHRFLNSNINALVDELESKKTRDDNRYTTADNKIISLESSTQSLDETDNLHNTRITSNENLLTQYGQDIEKIRDNIALNHALISSNLTFAMGNSNAILTTANFIQQSNQQRFVNLTDHLNKFFNFENLDKQMWSDRSFHDAIDEYYSSESMNLNTQFSTMTDLIGRVHSNDIFVKDTYQSDKKVQSEHNNEVDSFMKVQQQSNSDMEQRITTNFEDIGSNTSDITQLEQQYKTLTETLQAVGIVNTDGTTVSTEMSLTELNSNILYNASNIRHFNDNVENLFTSRFADILGSNTSHLDVQALQTKIEGIHFDNLKFGEGKDFNAFSNDIFHKINSLTTNLSTSSTTSGDLKETFNTYFNTNNSDISIQDGKTLTVGGETNLKIGNDTLPVYLKTKNYQKAKPDKFCFENDLCIKPCNGNRLCIENNNTTTIIWDHNQAPTQG